MISTFMRLMSVVYRLRLSKVFLEYLDGNCLLIVTCKSKKSGLKLYTLHHRLESYHCNLLAAFTDFL